MPWRRRTRLACHHGLRKVWVMARHAGHPVACSTVLQILDEESLLLMTGYQP